MAGNTRTLKLVIAGDPKGAVKAFGDTERAAGGFQSKVSKVGSTIGKALAIGGTVAIAGAGIAKVGKGFYDAAIESIKISEQTAAVVKSTNGVAGVTTKGVSSLADKLAALSGIDDEVVQSGENMLLTFTKVRNAAGKGNDIFDQATKAALDYSVATGTDLVSANKQLGKALQDPAKGVMMLGRAGVTFTKQQKDQIKWMSAAGDTAGAQRIILKEFTKEFGGSAAAQATAGARLKVAWGNVQEEIGKKLVPVVEKFAKIVADNLPKITKFVEDHGTAFKVAAGIIATVGVVAMLAYAASAAAAAAATIAATWPILAIGAAIAALAAGVVYAYKHWKTFHDVVDAVGRFIKGTVWPLIQQFARGVADQFRTMVSLVSGSMRAAKTYIVEPIKSAVSQVSSWVNAIPGFFTNIPARISAATSGMFSGIKSAFRSAVNYVIDGWNGLSFHIPGFDPPGPGPKFGGFTLSTPNIPRLHSGGMVPGSGEYPAILLGGERVLNRREAAAYNGGGSQVFELYIDGVQVEAVVRRRAQDREARTGKAWTA